MAFQTENQSKVTQERFPMDLKKGQTLEIAVTDIAYGGKGLARLDGLAVFVDQAVPGDRVVIQITRKKPNYAEARVVELLEPSPHRVTPPCEYSSVCGGCKWQFLRYEQQLIFKRQHVVDALEHIGQLQDVRVLPIIPSELQFGYRNKMEFSCSDRRWLLPTELGKPDIDKGFALGLHVPGTFHKVLDTRACLLQPDLGNQLLGEVRTFMRSSGAPVYGLKSHKGFWRFLVLRHSVANDQWMVNIITAEDNTTKIQPLAKLLMERYPQVTSVVNNVTSRKAGVAIGEIEHTIAGASVISDRIDRYDFEISANSFFQTNTRGAYKLYKIVEEYAGLTGSETVLDLYSGTGTIPILLSESSKEIIGIEIIASAVADAEKNCRNNSISNCRFIQGDIRTCLLQIQKRPDVLIIDPPRTGMHKDVVHQVLALGAERIVYVSCNPATMARDLAIMRDSYRLIAVQPVDMFPHTFHIETIAKLAKLSPRLQGKG
jgi:23S rRNA (uracil1939-C5)-methyltransferase